MYNYLRALQLRRTTNLYAPDTGAQGGAESTAGASGTAAAQTAAEGAQGASGGAESAGGESTGEDKTDGKSAAKDTEKPKALTQADVDRIIRQERAKWQRQQERAVADARTEAEKLATMTAEQRAEHEREQREKKLAEREATITRRELKAEAVETLTEKGLPAKLAEVLDYTDADKCSASIEAVEAAFRAAVQQGVNERLKGSAPKAATGAAKVDYAKMAREAAERGNMAEAARYTRLAGTK